MRHDPRTTVELLRSVLAGKDIPLSFLLGAGSSAAVTVDDGNGSVKPLVPAIQPLTEECKQVVYALGDEFEKAWDAVSAECTAANESANIENILTRVRRKIEAIGLGDTPLGLERGKLEEFEKAIREEIVRQVDVSDDQFPDSLPHDDFAEWVRAARRSHPVEIFTSNYDVLIERALDRRGVLVFDGFVGGWRPYFSSDAIALFPPHADWTRLWKIHGSVNWASAKNGPRPQVTRVMQAGDGTMILPSYRKYDESRKAPYTAILDRLVSVLRQEASVLMVCGFSFSDDHINEIILSSLRAHPRTHCYALQYGALEEDALLSDYGRSHPNLVVLARNAGIVGGQYGDWGDATQLGEDLPIVLPCFDKDENGKVQFTLGDFRIFSDYLRSLVGVSST